MSIYWPSAHSATVPGMDVGWDLVVGLSGASGRQFGGLLGAVLGPLLGLLGRLGGLLGASWQFGGLLGAVLEPFGACRRYASSGTDQVPLETCRQYA